MTEQEIDQAIGEGNIKRIKPSTQPEQASLSGPTLNDFIAVLTALQAVKRHRTVDTAPDMIPQTFLDSFQTFDDGTDQGVYIYINKTWRKITAT